MNGAVKTIDDGSVAYLEGDVASLACMRESDCPYPYGTQEHHDWRAGWNGVTEEEVGVARQHEVEAAR